MKKRYICCLPLLVCAFGTITIGCLPTGENEFTKYDVARYVANTDSTGWGGTWMVTMTGWEYGSGDTVGYRRHIVRLAPVEGTSDTYRYYSCGDYSYDGVSNAPATVISVDSTLTLPLYEGHHAVLQLQGNGRAHVIWDVQSGAEHQQAVRLSGDPRFSIGTITATENQTPELVATGAADCFSEYQIELSDGSSEYFLAAASFASADIDEGSNLIPVVEVHRYAGYGDEFTGAAREGIRDWFGFFGGSALINTVRSSSSGVTGGATGPNSNGQVAGKIRFDIKF